MTDPDVSTWEAEGGTPEAELDDYEMDWYDCD